jgi:hypothetical protein
MAAYWPLRMVSRILDAVDDLGLVGLPRIGQLFDALVGCVRDLRESLGVS